MHTKQCMAAALVRIIERYRDDPDISRMDFLGVARDNYWHVANGFLMHNTDEWCTCT